MSDKENTISSTIKTFHDVENKKKNAQSAERMTERKLSLLGTVGLAQKFLSVDFVLDIKRKMYGTKRKLNDLEAWELTRLINELRRHHVRREKLHKRNNTKRKDL
jgi:hypothetical protein